MNDMYIAWNSTSVFFRVNVYRYVYFLNSNHFKFYFLGNMRFKRNFPPHRL